MTDLDLDDVAATSPKAAAELAALRAECASLRGLLAEANEHLPIAAASWHEEPQYSDQVDSALGLIRRINAVITAQTQGQRA